MKSVAIRVVSILLLSTQAASAEPSGSPLYEVGYEACKAVLDGQEATFGEKYYLRFADLVDMDRVDLCDCVGERFENNAEEQNARLAAAESDGELEVFLDITKRNLDSCLPDFDELDFATQGMIMRGAPEGSHEMAEARNAVSGEDGDGPQADERLCRMIVAGEVEAEYFDADYRATWEQQSGLKASDLCGECVVAMMQDARETAIEEGSLWQVNDELHRDKVAGATTECMNLTYRLSLN